MDAFSFFSMPEAAPKEVKKAGGTGCANCVHSKGPMAGVFGAGRLRILFVAESPTQQETASNSPLHGAHWPIFQELCGKLDIDPLRDGWLVYASPCGEKAEATCRPNIMAHIEALNPAIIVPLGFGGVTSVVGGHLTGRMKSTVPSAFFGERIPDQKLGRWICPTYSPWQIAKLEGMKNDRARRTPWHALDLRNLFVKQLKAALELASAPVPKAPGAERVEVLLEPAKIVEMLESLAKYHGPLTFDFETTGLKPHKAGHYIDCASICVDDDAEDFKAYAFPFLRNNPAFMAAWRAIMQNPKIKKIAHNAQFEAAWEKVRGAGEWVKGWWWDTCIGQHVLHNAKPSNLKFCTYVRQGVAGYDDEMDRFLSASSEAEDKDGANAINRIADAPVIPKLTYCGLDSVYTHLEQRLQHHEMRKAHNRRGFALLMEAMPEMARATECGFRFDEAKAAARLAELADQIRSLEARIFAMPEMAPYQGVNLNGDQQVISLLYDKLKYPLSRFGRKADAASLKELNTPLTLLMAELNKLGTTRGYLSNYLRESVDGVVHGGTSLVGTVTFRPSSSSPNMANIPKRDKAMKKAARSCYTPSPGNCLMECDFKGAEVTANGCITLDEKLLEYLRDWQHTDMHRDMAQQMYLRLGKPPIDPKLAKEERQSVKGPFTFAEFYGMTVNSGVAEGTWYAMPKATREHVSSLGLDTLEKWKRHMQAIEDDFWGNRFKAYGQWKFDIWRELRENTYIDQPTGFRCHAPMDYNQATNILAQGAAFHCNLRALIRVAKRLREATRGRSNFLIQIYDAQVYDIHPDDKPLLMQLLKEELENLKKDWTWIIVPLIIETESSAVDGIWAEMEEGEMIVVE